jgi:hypothetical protein
MNQPILRRSTDVLKVVGFDPSLRNWGIAVGTYVPATNDIEITNLDVTCAIVNEGKQVRQNSQDLDVAEQLAKAALAAAVGAQAIFVEVPVGSQSARSMASYGVCVGVLGALRASGIAFFEVNPEEVKIATGLKKTASKAEMIAWALATHPDAPWPMQTVKGVVSPVAKKAEHMADACAAIHAGVISKPFQQALHFIMKQGN